MIVRWDFDNPEFLETRSGAGAVVFLAHPDNR